MLWLVGFLLVGGGGLIVTGLTLHSTTATPLPPPTTTPLPLSSPTGVPLPRATPTPPATATTLAVTVTEPPSILPTPDAATRAPVALAIPAIDLEVPVIPIGWKLVDVAGAKHAMWDVPNWRAVGWHETSAPLGLPGNTVLNGHNTRNGEVFRDLYTLDIGARITVTAQTGAQYTYAVAEKLFLPEAGQPLDVRLANAQYTLPTDDERLTLITCHPYGSLDYRLILIAYPVKQGGP